MTPEPIRLNRRRLLQLAGTLPIGVLIAMACGGSSSDTSPTDIDTLPELQRPEPTPTATPEPPFIVSAGEERRQLMEGTPQQTPLYIFGSGVEGQIMLVLGGVHGNEPGGWMAADRVAQTYRPARGALLVIPSANKLAMAGFVRTTDDLGDLNRLYPGDPNGMPMARMAYQIMQTIRDFHVDTVIDMHESWAFYKDRPQNGTAFLGQTVSTPPMEPAATLARDVVAAVNTRIQSPQEELFVRDFPSRNNTPTPDGPGSIQGGGVSGGSQSSLGIPNFQPGTTAILVEMGQQQALERRIGLHVEVFKEVARRLNVIDA